MTIFGLGPGTHMLAKVPIRQHLLQLIPTKDNLTINWCQQRYSAMQMRLHPRSAASTFLGTDQVEPCGRWPDRAESLMTENKDVVWEEKKVLAMFQLRFSTSCVHSHLVTSSPLL